jgi:hypothetical protein
VTLVDELVTTTKGVRPVAPAFVHHGTEFSLTWPWPPVVMTLTGVRESRGAIHAELTVLHEGHDLHFGRLDLVSTSARETVVKKLAASIDTVPWRGMLEDACRLTARASRRGEPMVTLTGKVASPTRELLPRLLYEGEPTLVYGDGDTGKSLFALTIAAAMQSGTALPFGLKPARAVTAAYLDWETGQDSIEARLAVIANGLGIDPPPILYKRMTRPLVDEAPVLAADFARRDVGAVMIDSKIFAVAGGDGAAFHEPITAFYGALRLFGKAAALVLNHVTNDTAKNGGPSRPFGGAFAYNAPRLIWEAKRDKDVTDATAIAFTCTKANNLPRRPDPFGLKFVPGDGTITVYPFNLAEATPQTIASASLPYRIRLALASQGDMSTPDIAEALGVADSAVRTALGRLKAKGGIVVERKAAAGKPTLWGLV